MTFDTTCFLYKMAIIVNHVSMIMVLIKSKLLLEPVQFFMTTFVLKYTLNGIFFFFFLTH